MPNLFALILAPLLVFAPVIAPVVALAAPWQLLPDTSVAVDVPWQGRTVTVRFPDLSGTIDFDQNHPDRTEADITVDATTATTGVSVVDALVRSADYLGSGRYPTITFHLQSLKQTSKSAAKVAGEITLRGVTRPIRFDATVLRYGPATGDSGRFEAGFALSGTIDRTEFGSTGGLPDVGADLPVRIRLMMASK